MFERFTEKAIKTIMLAQEEACRLGHNFVGTEQILLGLIGEGTGIAGKALKGAGANLKDTRIEVEKIIGRGAGFVSVEIPFTPRAKRLIEYAWEESEELAHDYIGTEHLLLGLIRENEGVGIRVLENIGIDSNLLKEEVLKHVGPASAVATNENPSKVKESGQESKIEFWDSAVFKSLVNILVSGPAREIGLQLADVCHKKFMAITNQEFDKAAALREQESHLEEELRKIQASNVGAQLSELVLPTVEYYTDSLLKAILLAREECRRLHYNNLDPEHLLLGLIAEGAGTTGKVFQSAGLKLDPARLEAEKFISKGFSTIATYIPFTPLAKEVLVQAQTEAKRCGLLYIKKEHLLMVLLDEPKGNVKSLFKNLGTDIKKMKEELANLMNEQNMTE